MTELQHDENAVEDYTPEEIAEGKAVELEEIGETITVQDAVDAEDQPTR